MMYVVVHLYGGLLESVTPVTSLKEAQRRWRDAIPTPCRCGGDRCQAYQEAYILKGNLGEEFERIAERHSPWNTTWQPWASQYAGGE